MGVRQAGVPVIFPIHPRSRSVAQAFGVGDGDGIIVCEPLGYKDMIAAEALARVVVTDSWGVQKQAAALGTPCVTLREETEWTETVASGQNVLVGTDEKRIVAAIAHGDYSAPLFVGKVVSVDGNQVGPTFTASHVFRLTNLANLPPDR
jgi:UDP-GlcNAc3NAcA epimerase